MRVSAAAMAVEVMVVVAALAARDARGDIRGSKHDFSAEQWSDHTICNPCHTPHTSHSGVSGELWAHSPSAATAYNYHGPSIGAAQLAKLPQSTSMAPDELDSATRLCLSCHDGTVALDSFMGKLGGSDGRAMGADAAHGSPAANLGADLSDDHPVGSRSLYRESQSSYRPLSTAMAAGLRFNWSASPAAAVPPGTKDQSGQPIAYTHWPSVSCITCHDVHNLRNTDGGVHLLRVSNTASQICLTCHQ